MDGGSWLPYILLVLLILGGGYFAGAEISFASFNKIRLRNYAEGGDRRSKKALYISNHFDKALTTLLIGNNLMHIGCASLATLIATRLWGVGAVAYSTVVITVVVFLISEMIPKSFAKAYSERFALSVSGSLYFLMKILTPITFLFTSISKLASKLFGKKNEPTVTEEELYEIIDTIEEEGSLSEDKSDLVRSALEFADITVQDVLTSRVDLVSIDADMAEGEILSLIKAQKYSRLPVYEDTIDNIIGILQIRKYLKNYVRFQGNVHLKDLLDEPHFVHKSTRIDDLLEEMSRKKLHLAIVTDDYGGTMGIVTVEDILEELVGEIWDEDDEVVEEFVKIGGNRFEVSGDLLVEDAFEEMEYENYDEEAFSHKTMGGWALDHFEFIPHEGDHFVYNDLMVTITKMDHQRIVKLLIKWTPPVSPEPQESIKANLIGVDLKHGQ
ncbi:MAG: HlyC/CorC family transporter [Bacillota bacterium]|nr:MAG: HlyC/CorC family transporter [Bacillota bacterium]